MHIMEDECNKPSAASTVIENLPKTNGSPTPCQNSVPALDSEEKVPQENGTDQEEQLEPSKPEEDEEEEGEGDETEKAQIHEQGIFKFLV